MGLVWYKIDENTLLMPFGNKLGEPLVPEPIGVMTSMPTLILNLLQALFSGVVSKNNGIQ